MLIRKYIQGTDDKKIFCNVGAWLTNKTVHEELGMAITSQDGDIWYLVFLSDIVIGFALTRDIATKKAIHIRFLYSDPETKKSLIKRILKDAVENDNKIVSTNDRGSENVWKEFKFKFTARARGEFGRWELEIKKHKKGAKK